MNNGFTTLISNLISLFFVGLCLEPLLGKNRLLAIYLLGGLCGGITSMSWNYYVNTTGASAAVFGLYGVLLVLALMKIFVFDTKLKLLYFGVASFSLGLTFCFKCKNFSDSSADMGGLAFGIFIGAIGCETIKKALENKKRN